MWQIGDMSITKNINRDGVVRARAKQMDFWNEVVAFVRENEGCPLWVLAWRFRNHYGDTISAYRCLEDLIGKKRIPELYTERSQPPRRNILSYRSVHLIVEYREVETQKVETQKVLRSHSICLESKKL